MAGLVVYVAISIHVFSLLVATPLGATLSSLSVLQQEALYIPRSALSELELIGEGNHVLTSCQRLFALQYSNVYTTCHY